MGVFVMPSLGADMDAGTVIEWRVGPGSAVRRGEIVALVQTEKADIEIEVFETGEITAILVPEGVEVAVGTPLATIATVRAAGEVDAVPPAATPPSLPAPSAAAPASSGEAVHPRITSPLVRKLAAATHVDLATLAGSGPGGRITRRDVEHATRKPVASAPPPRRAAPRAPVTPGPRTPTRAAVSPAARRRAVELGVALDGLRGSGPGGAIVYDDVARAATAAAPPSPLDAQRRAVAQLMARSKREIPHYYLAHDIDVTDTMGWLSSQNATRSVQDRLLPAAALLHATARAAQAVPELNGHWVDGTFRPSTAVHLGVAVSTRGGGLLAPVIRDAHELDLDGLMAALRSVVARARSGTLRGADVDAATITVTNLGERGSDAVWGVIVPPQVAIVGFGRVSDRPAVHDGTVCVRQLVTATLSGDHRASHGHQGAQLLTAIARHLSRPEDR